MYIIQEIQTTDGVTALLPPETYDTKANAEQAFHYKLSFAATSTVGIHTVMMYDEYGTVRKAETYLHSSEAPEETEQVEEV